MLISQRIAQLGPDERKIIELLLERLEEGRSSYGDWNVGDGRDYVAEALDEVLDGLHYCAAALIRLTGCRGIYRDNDEEVCA